MAKIGEHRLNCRNGWSVCHFTSANKSQSLKKNAEGLLKVVETTGESRA